MFVTSYDQDYVTSNISLWAFEIVKFAQDEKGIKVIHLNDKREDSKATKQNVTNYLKKKKPQFVFLNGHGDERKVCGHKDEPIIIMGDNEYLLEDKVIYILACNCGVDLAPSIVSKGKAKAVISYKERFCLPVNEERYCTPIKNDMVIAIKEMSNAIPRALIKGRTVIEAIRSANIVWAYWDDKFQKQDPSEKAETILWVLDHNIKSLSIEGDPDASVSY